MAVTHVVRTHSNVEGTRIHSFYAIGLKLYSRYEDFYRCLTHVLPVAFSVAQSLSGYIYLDENFSEFQSILVAFITSSQVS